jgi:hypothetical protein
MSGSWGQVPSRARTGCSAVVRFTAFEGTRAADLTGLT